MLEVEHGSFTPLVFSATGGMGQPCSTRHLWETNLSASREEASYHQVISWFHCLLNVSLLGPTVMCIRGARATSNGPGRPAVRDNPLDLAACTHVDVGASC